MICLIPVSNVYIISSNSALSLFTTSGSKFLIYILSLDVSMDLFAALYKSLVLNESYDYSPEMILVTEAPVSVSFGTYCSFISWLYYLLSNVYSVALFSTGGEKMSSSSIVLATKSSKEGLVIFLWKLFGQDVSIFEIFSTLFKYFFGTSPASSYPLRYMLLLYPLFWLEPILIGENLFYLFWTKVIGYCL